MLHPRVMCLCLAVSTLTAVGSTSPIPVAADDKADVKVAAQGSYRISGEQDGPLAFLTERGVTKELIIRGKADLKEVVPKGMDVERAEARICKALGIEKIDWSKHMLIAFSPGWTSAEWTISFESVEASRGTITVKWKATPTGKLAKTRPIGVALIEQSDKTVFFDPRDWKEPVH